MRTMVRHRRCILLVVPVRRICIHHILLPEGRHTKLWMQLTPAGNFRRETILPREDESASLSHLAAIQRGASSSLLRFIEETSPLPLAGRKRLAKWLLIFNVESLMKRCERTRRLALPSPPLLIPFPLPRIPLSRAVVKKHYRAFDRRVIVIQSLRAQYRIFELSVRKIWHLHLQLDEGVSRYLAARARARAQYGQSR